MVGSVMSLGKDLLTALSVTLRAGGVGASFILALGATQAGAVGHRDVEHPVDSQIGVSERLRVIRAGVDELANSQAAPGSAELESHRAGATATWWGNGRWGRWRHGWGNGGWGWPNWHNWPNGWHNWGNGGWNNWGNGWHNYWHNT
jgi:hypothetical protein